MITVAANENESHIFFQILLFLHWKSRELASELCGEKCDIFKIFTLFTVELNYTLLLFVHCNIKSQNHTKRSAREKKMVEMRYYLNERSNVSANSFSL